MEHRHIDTDIGTAHDMCKQYLARLVGLVCCLQSELIEAVVGCAQDSDESAVPLHLHGTLYLCLSHCKLLPRGVGLHA